MESNSLIREGEPKLSLSQSLLKNYWAWKDGKHCGIAFHRLDIRKEAFKPPTERMKLGHWFEYLCTGATLRDGTVPEEPLTKTGKPKAEGIRMKAQAKRFKRLLEVEQIEITDTGVTVEHDMGEFKMKGIYDAIATINGVPSIVDIKSSGLIGNEWEEYGWHSGTFNMRKSLTIQVIFYKYLAWKSLGVRDMPFYFIVHSTTNEFDSLFWEVQVKDFDVAMSHFEDMVLESVDNISFYREMGFTPHPSIKRCKDCPLKNDCAHVTDTAEKETVIIDGIFE